MRNTHKRMNRPLNFTRLTQPLSRLENVSISPKMTQNIQSFIYELGKYVVGALGGIVAILAPTIPFIVICTIAVLMDCYTAWALSKRVKKKFPGANDGKFKSHYAGRVFLTLLKVYAVIVLAFLIDQHIFPDFTLLLPNIIAGAVCFWQMWSMLENESSCNDAKWAIVAQRIMVDKTERHFDLDLHELKEHEVVKCANRECAYNGTIACKTANAKHCPNYRPIKDTAETPDVK